MATYIDGTYGLKYYKSITNERDVVIRLEIHRRGYTGTSYEIADLQGLALQVQGAQGDAEAPIIKTSLRFGLLDNRHAEGINASGIAGTRKFAYWQEFFTPDSTLYLVKLLRDGSLFWSGYVTPDSYTESLDAFGAVGIIARDNLGHLQDFEFDLQADANGLVNVVDIITAAAAKIALPLNLTFPESDCPTLQVADALLECTCNDLQVCASALEGKDWYEALEGVLASLGWCLRFLGYNVLFCAPLRLLDTFANRYYDAPPSEEVAFLGRGSGTRTYDPAWRRIVEEADFGQAADVTLGVDAAKTGTKTTSTTGFATFFKYNNIFFHHEANAPIVSASAGHVLGDWEALPTTWILDDKNYTAEPAMQEAEGDALHNYLYLAANVGVYAGSQNFTWADLNQTFARRVRNTAATLKMEFAASPGGITSGGDLVAVSARLQEAAYIIKYEGRGGTTCYWNGIAWQAASVVIRKTYDVGAEDVTTLEETLDECTDAGLYGTLSITFRRLIYMCSLDSVAAWPDGLYARLKAVTFSSNVQRRMGKSTITTIVNDAYNVQADRDPMFNVLPQSVGFVLPQNYERAFYYYDLDGNPQVAPWLWQWSDDTEALPFPVKVHQQLLQYHSTTQEVLEGACRPYDYQQDGQPGVLVYGGEVLYKGVAHLLLSVTHDLLTDRWTSAILRSWQHYRDLWDGDETRGGDGSLA